jgi:hypothetical protein
LALRVYGVISLIALVFPIERGFPHLLQRNFPPYTDRRLNPPLKKTIELPSSWARKGSFLPLYDDIELNIDYKSI